MNKFIIVSYYTENTKYKNIFDTFLLPSLTQLRLPYCVEVLENKGDWYKNAMQKPLFIKRMFNKFKENIVWVDVDAKINIYPLLFSQIPEEYDIAIHTLDWKLHYGRDGKEFVDGTIFIRNTDKMRRFIDEWITVSTAIGKNHQKPLEKLLRERKDIKVFELPRTYCYITSTPRGKDPVVKVDNPVISHYQASRLAKRNLYNEKY